MKDTPKQQDEEQAVALLLLVQHYPASEHETREKTKRLLASWSGGIPAERSIAAKARGETLELEEVVEGIVQNFPEEATGNPGLG